MYKFTIALGLILCCTLQCGVSTPVASAPADDLMNEISVIGKKAYALLETVGYYVTEVARIISLGALRGVLKGVMPFYWRVEMFAMSTGNYVDRPSTSGVEDKEQFLTFMTVTDMWQKLNIMEKMDEVITNVTKETTSYVFTVNLDLRKGLKFMQKNFETTLKQDQGLYDDYVKLLGANEINFDISKMGKMYKTLPYQEVAIFDADKAFANPKFMRLFFNKIFLTNSVNRITTTDKKYFITARSIIELAKKPGETDKIQKIYDDCLTESTDQFLQKRKFEIYAATDDQLVEMLLKNLQAKFDADSALSKDLEFMKEQVAKKKDWNKCLFDIDIWPL